MSADEYQKGLKRKWRKGIEVCYRKIPLKLKYSSCFILIHLILSQNKQFIEGQFLFLLMFSLSARVLFLLIVSSIILWGASNITHQVSSTPRLLEKAIQMVQLNPLFIVDRLQNLVKERKWDQIIEVSSHVLKLYQKYEGSFKFWYFRALSQCALFQIKNCRQSWLNASLFAGDKYRTSIQRMEELYFLNSKKERNTNNNQQNFLLV